MKAGTLAYQVGSESSSANLAVSPSRDRQATCTTSGLDGEIFKDEFVNTIGPSVRCATPTGYVYVSFEKLGDPRGWVLGARTLRGRESGLAIELSDCPAQGPCLPCEAAVDDATVTVVVEQAAGAAAPYPKMVTSDYRRTYRIEIDTGSRTTQNGATACKPLAIKASLQLEQTAADFVDNPQGQCTACE